ncbi:MAG: GntR family transcriptional regulator [Verrucomicrobia bacterium]|jgi:DNA-binding GntR family transcriptional regulator|nr:GntR family transcriptional regulator [Verrucomicrobiota bacterium]
MKSVNSDVAYDYIRKRILNGEYPPGRGLATITLAEEIGVSRTPVRDALRQLESDGLVTIQPRLGASVTRLSLEEYRELCELRLALESHAARLAAINRTDSDLHEIAQALEAMRRITKAIATSADERRLTAEMGREDVRFHLAIISAAKNALMKKEILRLHLINRVVLAPSPGSDPESDTKAGRDAHRRLVLQSHDAIFRAVEQREANAAHAAMEEHIQDIINRSVRTVAGAEADQAGKELTEEELSYTP